MLHFRDCAFGDLQHFTKCIITKNSSVFYDGVFPTKFKTLKYTIVKGMIATNGMNVT